MGSDGNAGKQIEDIGIWSGTHDDTDKPMDPDKSPPPLVGFFSSMETVRMISGGSKRLDLWGMYKN